MNKQTTLKSTTSRGVASLGRLADSLSDAGQNSIGLEILKIGALLKDPNLTWQLADASYFGEGTEVSKDDAIVYYKSAARMGVAEAYTSLGIHYFEKRSDKDKKAGIAFYRKAAKMEEPHAIHNLGVCYSTGVGLKKNPEKAFQLFKRSADLGHEEAQFKTGWCLWFGEGISNDMAHSKRYLRRAVKQGHTEAKKLLEKSSERHA